MYQKVPAQKVFKMPKNSAVRKTNKNFTQNTENKYQKSLKNLKIETTRTKRLFAN